MRLSGTSWFWITAMSVVAVGVCLVLRPAQAQWDYECQDDFSNDFAESHSYLHSLFWPQGKFFQPPLLVWLNLTYFSLSLKPFRISHSRPLVGNSKR